MKRLIALALLCALSGCAHPPFPPDVTGKPEPVNTPQIISEFGND